MLERKDADLTAASLKHNEVLQDLQNTQLLLEQKDVEMRTAVKEAKEQEGGKAKAVKQARDAESAKKSLEMQLETKAGELRTIQVLVPLGLPQRGHFLILAAFLVSRRVHWKAQTRARNKRWNQGMI